MSPFAQGPRGEVVDSCRELIGRFDEDHSAIFSLLSGNKVSTGIDDFLSLRRSVWPDSLFYHPDFSLQRMLIAVGIACDPNNVWTAAPMCRSVLGLDNGILPNNMQFHVETDMGYNLFHGLTSKIGQSHGTENAGEWHALIRDVVKHLADIRDLSHRGPMTLLSEGAKVSETPLSVLIWEGLRARMGSYRQHVAIRSTDSAAVLAGCENSIFAWLADLYEGGIDLNLYGENEMEHFRHQEVSRFEGYPLNGMTYDYSSSRPGVDEIDRGHLYSVRLLNFHYGRFPTDWKFWWSEPSDEFAGDFWILIESGTQEALSVPGAWVD